MSFFTRNRAAQDLHDWQPKIIAESLHYAVVEMPDKFVSSPENVLQLFERLHCLGLEVLEISPVGRAVARKILPIHPFERLARDLLDPELYGHAVTVEVRNAARRALGLVASETGKAGNHA